ncbi:MAG TPA: GAF domain-containing protein [Amycolatopsis sp.]|nr:GAF domain-containing protein [Amycolatopsis sp.]
MTTGVAQLRADVLAALARPGVPGGTDVVGQVCRACARLLPVNGAALSVVSGAGHQQTIYASDATSAALADLQFSLGEGPCCQANATGEAVLVPDLARGSVLSWPVFAGQAAQQPVAALFTFPVRVGAVQVATLDTYRATAGALTSAELSTAWQVADVAGWTLPSFATAERPLLDAGGRLPETAVRWHREIHQATGVLIAQLDLPAAAALARMRAYAFGRGRSLAEVAAGIVSGRLRLDLEPD